MSSSWSLAATNSHQ